MSILKPWPFLLFFVRLAHQFHPIILLSASLFLRGQRTFNNLFLCVQKMKCFQCSTCNTWKCCSSCIEIKMYWKKVYKRKMNYLDGEDNLYIFSISSTSLLFDVYCLLNLALMLEPNFTTLVDGYYNGPRQTSFTVSTQVDGVDEGRGWDSQ